MTAFTNHASELAAQGLKLANSKINGIQVPTCYTVGQGTVCFWPICQADQFLYVFQRKAQISAVTNEQQAVQMAICIAPLIAM